jgi:2-oxoglutarate/2-oxoacid ferredoxin oxidoreductase subunit alpha
MVAQKKEFTPKGLYNMQHKPVFKIKIAGQAGQGIKSAGLMVAKFATRSGYNIYNYIEYPSIIRGGHNVMQINISENEVTGPSRECDFLIALNAESVIKHRDSMTSTSFILYDPDTKINTEKLHDGVSLLAIPMNKIAHEAGGMDLLSNTVALGAFIWLVNGDFAVFSQLVTEEYCDKKTEVLASNSKALELGYNFAKDNFASYTDKVFKLPNLQKSSSQKLVLHGDEAVALGAIAAGMNFAAIYPMSPISNILHVLTKHQKEYKYIYKQPEDEIAAINMAIGASYAGARAMTATSGGGFCLMTEGYGLAGMTETPLVIILGMRGGPATGLPTWNTQGDLQFVLHAHQDEFPRIVMAAGDNVDAFYMTMEAFYIADKYQTPVVVLLDKNICDHEQSVPPFQTAGYRVDRGKFTTQVDANYKRFLLNVDGVSVRTIPGVGNFFIANSDEHTEVGFSSEEAQNRIDQMSKRMTKLETCAAQDMPEPLVFGPKDAEITLVSWGSNKGSILQAMHNFESVNYLHIGWMNPFPAQFVADFLAKSSKTLLVESNYTGQLGNLIAEKTGYKFTDKILKFDGRPFFVEELVEQIKNRIGGQK